MPFASEDTKSLRTSVDWYSGNYEDLLIVKLGQSGKTREANFAAKKGPEIFWTSESVDSANTRLLVIKVYGRKSALLEF
jgi:hypothetical protein